MQDHEWLDVARLITTSTNTWYLTHGMDEIFIGPPENQILFCETYEALDPGCCLLAEDIETGELAGSCFYHPRSTHVSLGIMNVHPDFAGQGVAGLLLDWIIDYAETLDLPVRLVSSALNLDSFSLYNRRGFVPQRAFQDLLITIPAKGFPEPEPAQGFIRDAIIDDAEAIAALEKELLGIDREKDYRHFIENGRGCWHVSVYESDAGELQGAIVSIIDPGSKMLGPGFAREADQLGALIVHELNQRKGQTLVLLLPADCPELVHRMYALGARNCELHFSQVRGEMPESKALYMPTFMPETA
ncbi:MAG: GNAT superfamily N-acetyltransferase [Kiritimatiellia bacterium]|jgi:GNAT superfamily N-acetyltransferase